MIIGPMSFCSQFKHNAQQQWSYEADHQLIVIKTVFGLENKKQTRIVVDYKGSGVKAKDWGAKPADIFISGIRYWERLHGGCHDI